jgi:hypothetical protein
MPASTEVVLNTALTAAELIDILRNDFEKLLKNDGMLSTSTAYGRTAYTIALRIEHGNPFLPVTTTKVESVPYSDQVTQRWPQTKALERPPLQQPVVEGAAGTTTAHRVITSPNQERLRMGLPIPVRRQNQDSTFSVEGIKYPQPEQDEDKGMSIVDEQTARERGWNIIDASKDDR